MLQYILGVVLPIREISRNITFQAFWLKRSYTFIMGVHICICVIILSFIVRFLMGNSPESEFYMPTFRNTMSHFYKPMKMEQTECSETLTYTIQTPGNYTEENIQHTEHGESLKSRKI